jgi:hypothetical protein
MSRAISLAELRARGVDVRSVLEIAQRKGRSGAPRAKRRDLEHEQQCELFAWARANEAKIPELVWLFAVPNFSGRIGNLTARHAARLNREGRKQGVPDCVFPLQRGPHPGLIIEMKAGKNRPTPQQRAWLDHFERQGWRTRVSYSFADARDAILAYLGITQ